MLERVPTSSANNTTTPIKRTKPVKLSDAVEVVTPEWDPHPHKELRILQRTQTNLWMEWIPQKCHSSDAKVRNNFNNCSSNI